MKSERLYLRIEPSKKAYLQEVADEHFDGAISTVIDFLVERLDMHLEGADVSE